MNDNYPAAIKMDQEFSTMQDVYAEFSKTLQNKAVIKPPTGWNKFFKKPQITRDENGVYAAELLVTSLEQLRTLCKLEAKFNNFQNNAEKINKALFSEIEKEIPFILLNIDEASQTEFVNDSNTLTNNVIETMENVNVSRSNLSSAKNSVRVILELVHNYIVQGRGQDYVRNIKNVDFETIAIFLDNYKSINEILPSVQKDIANVYEVELLPAEDKLDFYYEQELNSFVIPLRVKIIDSI